MTKQEQIIELQQALKLMTDQVKENWIDIDDLKKDKVLLRMVIDELHINNDSIVEELNKRNTILSLIEDIFISGNFKIETYNESMLANLMSEIGIDIIKK